MPESYYELSRNPFRKAPDPDHMFLTTAAEEAMARLEHAALEREIGVLTGDIGVGKTTITRALIDRLDEAVDIVWILNPRLTPNQLLRQIARRLDFEEVPRDRVDLLEGIQDRIVAAWEAGRPVVLLIDEAQMLPFPDTLEELRLLTNLQMDMENLLGVLLVGQPELNRQLAHPRLAPLAQRIGVRFHLGPLEREETFRYIHSRAESVGRDTPLFNDEALETIHVFSRGVPRVINNICANALLEGFVREEDPIGADVVADVARDLGLTGPEPETTG